MPLRHGTLPPPAPSSRFPSKLSPHRMRGHLSLLMLCLVAVIQFGCAGRPEPVVIVAESPAVEKVDGRADGLMQLVRDPDLDRATRTDAVVELLDRDNPLELQRLADELRTTENGATRQVIVRALAVRSRRPQIQFAKPLLELLTRAEEPLLRDLAAALGRYEDASLVQSIAKLALDPKQASATRRGAIMAMGYHRLQETAAQLVELMDDKHPTAIRDAATNAMMYMTGRTDIGSDTHQWRQWWTRHAQQPRDQWLDLLIRGLSDRNVQLSTQNLQVQDRLIESQRQLYRAAARTDRPAMLVAMLGDPVPAVRQLATELAREWLNDEGEPATPELRAALIARLDDAVEAVRRRAAILLENQADESGAHAIAQRLAARTETSPDVLRAYLLMMTRLPQPQAIDAVLDLLGETELSSEAAAALAPAVDAKLLSARQITDAGKQLRKHLGDDAIPQPSYIELLGRIGNNKDWKYIDACMEVDDAAVRRAAARAWARSDRSLEALSDRADDPVILPIFIAAARERGEKLTTWSSLIAHKPREEQLVESWRRALIAMASRVPAIAVLDGDDYLAREGETRLLRRQILTAAIEPMIAEPQKLGAAGTSSLVDLLLTRAELALADGDPNAAANDYQRVATLQHRFTREQQRRHDLGLMQTRLVMGELEAALQLASQIVNANGADGHDATLANLCDILLDAAARNLELNQPQRSRQLLLAVRTLAGNALPAATQQRLNDLEKQVTLATAPTPGSAPTLSPVPSSTAPNGSTPAPGNGTTPAPAPTTPPASG